MILKNTCGFRFQHIIQSLNPQTGRAAMLWPHGVLFRDQEAGIRRSVIASDLIEAVIGLGPDLFYNSPMESCVVVLRRNKTLGRQGKIVFVNGVHEVTRERATSFLAPANLSKLIAAYQQPEQHPDLARLVDLSEISDNAYNLSIPLYVRARSADTSARDGQSLQSALADWQQSRSALRQQSSNAIRQSATLAA